MPSRQQGPIPIQGGKGAHQVCFVTWAPELRDGVSSLVIYRRTPRDELPICTRLSTKE